MGLFNDLSVVYVLVKEKHNASDDLDSTTTIEGVFRNYRDALQHAQFRAHRGSEFFIEEMPVR